MAALFRFEVFTPYRLFFADMIEAAIMTLADGEICIMDKHFSCTAPVVSGLLRIKTNDGEWHNAFVSSGILEVTEVKTILLVDTAEWPGEIDTKRAIASGKQARERLENAMLKFEIDRSKNEIRRSEYRLKVAELG